MFHCLTVFVDVCFISSLQYKCQSLVLTKRMSEPGFSMSEGKVFVIKGFIFDSLKLNQINHCWSFFRTYLYESIVIFFASASDPFGTV